MNFSVSAKEMERTGTKNPDGTEAVEQETKRPGIVSKKMLVISSMVLGSIAFLLWAMFGFPRKFKNPRNFKGNRCSLDAMTCPKGWHRIYNRCFFESEQKSTWRDSQANCMAYHGSLLIFSSQNEVIIRSSNMRYPLDGCKVVFPAELTKSDVSRTMEREEGREKNINVREKYQLVAFPVPLEQRSDALGPGIRHVWAQDQIQYPAHESKSHWLTFTLIISIIIPVAFIIIVIMVSPPRNSPTTVNPQTIKCPGKWIEVRYKCLYFSQDTRNWTASKTFCRSQRSELAQIDTRQELEFLEKHTGTFMYWIGLSRKQGEPWKWTNGKTFNPWFKISGNGYFAFLNADGVNSSQGFDDMKWICSKPQF